jgi:hypothetical protein
MAPTSGVLKGLAELIMYLKCPELEQWVLHLSLYQNHLEDMLKPWLLALTPELFDLLTLSMSNKFPGEVTLLFWKMTL